MLTPEDREIVIQALAAEHGMSQRRACQAGGVARSVARSTLRYQPVARDDSGVVAFPKAYVALNPRHGFGLLYDSARRQGKPEGKGGGRKRLNGQSPRRSSDVCFARACG